MATSLESLVSGWRAVLRDEMGAVCVSGCGQDEVSQVRRCKLGERAGAHLESVFAGRGRVGSRVARGKGCAGELVVCARALGHGGRERGGGVGGCRGEGRGRRGEGRREAGEGDSRGGLRGPRPARPGSPRSAPRSLSLDKHEHTAARLRSGSTHPRRPAHPAPARPFTSPTGRRSTSSPRSRHPSPLPQPARLQAPRSHRQRPLISESTRPTARARSAATTPPLSSISSLHASSLSSPLRLAACCTPSCTRGNTAD